MPIRAPQRLRRSLTACAAAAALVAGSAVLTTTPANAEPAVPVAENIAHPGPVYRAYPPADADNTVDLQASGGDGALTYEVVDQPEQGRVTIEGSVATLSFFNATPPGPNTFTYKAIDEDGEESNVATVSFDVLNREPLTRELEFSTERNTPLDIWPYARDEMGGPFPWTMPGNSVTFGTPEHGTVEPFFTEEDDAPIMVETGHKAIYVPEAGFTGTDTFTYTMTDRDGASTTSTITVHVTKPRPKVRGEVSDMRYRCEFYVKTNEDGMADPNGEYDEQVTNLVSSVMGGDVAFHIDVRAKAPQTLSPGEKFTVPEQEIDLKMPQGMAELLAGPEFYNGGTLEDGGFGQEEVGGQATAAAHFTETATGDEYDVDMSGLKSQMVPMTLPVSSDGVTIPVKGGLPELTAPQSGKLVVSMPEEFFIDAILDPGVLGVIKYVGLQCYAFEGQDLEIVSSEVVTQAKTKTMASAPKVAYGKQAKVNVKVSKKATGKVSVFKGKKNLGTAKVKQGKATVRLGRTSLKPGTHKLQVRFAGSKEFKASKTTTSLRVTKAKATVRATKAGPKKVVAKKTRAKVRVKVSAAGFRPDGKVTVRSSGKVIGKGRVNNGSVTVRVSRFATPGKKQLVVKYAGSSVTKADSDRLTIRVVRRR